MSHSYPKKRYHPVLCLILFGLISTDCSPNRRDNEQKDSAEKLPLVAPTSLSENGPEDEYSPLPKMEIQSIARRLDRNVGFIVAGAYVLETNPTHVIDNRLTYRTVAYLGVGKIVYVDSCDTEISTRRPAVYGLSLDSQSGRIETYCNIVTSSGIHGYVREDRVEYLGEEKIAIAIGESDIPVSHTLSVESSGRTFSRTNGVYVVIIDESRNGYYEVRIPWSSDETGWLSLSEKGSSYYVIDGTSRDVVPVEFEPFTDSVTQQIEALVGLPVEDILNEISDKSNQKFGSSAEPVGKLV